jgi:hypothetical protein
MGVPWKTFDIMGRVVGSKIIEEQKGVKDWRFAESECPLEVNASPLDGGFTFKYFTYCSCPGHDLASTVA